MQRSIRAKTTSRPSTKTGLALILMGSVALLSCARNPVSGRPNAVLMTEEGEIDQGSEAAKEVEDAIGFTSNAELAKYIQGIGDRLAARSPRSNIEHHFYVLNAVEPNAFALPGGYVYITRGLLARMNTEDELANIIGHEIGHVAARHSVTRQAAAAPLIPVRVATGVGGTLTSIVAPRLGKMIANIGQLPGMFSLAAYNREQEREADRLGQKFAAAAGWDPTGLSSLMHTLARERDFLIPDDTRIRFLDTHPPSPERSAAALAYSQELEIAETDARVETRDEFLDHLDGLVLGSRAEDGVFIETRYLHPEMGFGLSFPKDWNYKNNRGSVVATNGSGDSYLAVALDDPELEPMAHAEIFSEAMGVSRPPVAFEINGLPAARVVAEHAGLLGKPSMTRVSWIASRGKVYRIVGAAAISIFPEIAALLGASTRSFHELTADELAEIREFRRSFAQEITSRGSQRAVAIAGPPRLRRSQTGSN
jgi:predicted Zn-dependent protease